MHIYEHFCIIYSAFYDLLLWDSTCSTLGNLHTLTTNDLSFLTSEVFLTLHQGSILFLTCISSTFKDSHKMTNLFNRYYNFLFSLNKAPLDAALFFLSFFFIWVVLSFLFFLFDTVCLCFACSVTLSSYPCMFFLLGPIFVCPYCCSLWMKLPSDQGITPRLCSSASPARWWGRQQTSNMPSWHLTLWVCVPCRYWGFGSSTDVHLPLCCSQSLRQTR